MALRARCVCPLTQAKGHRRTMPSLIPRHPDAVGPEAGRGLRILRARTILADPAAGGVTARIDNGAVAVAGDRIVAVGAWPDIERRHSGRSVPVRDLGPVALAPGLVNAHTHLELCRLRGRTALGQGFETWVKSLIGQLPAGPDQGPAPQGALPDPRPGSSPEASPKASHDAVPESSEDALLAAVLEELRATGTACVADVSTRSPAFVSAGLERAGLEYVLFFEWFGHRFDRPGRRKPGSRPGAEAGRGTDRSDPAATSDPLRPAQPADRAGPASPLDLADPSHHEAAGLPWPASVASLPEGVRARRLAAGGHALYSTAPAMLQAAKAWDRARARPFTIHLAEHQGEVEFLRSGTGAFADLLKQRVVPRNWRAPGLSPVAYAQALGILDASTLAVHCVHLGEGDIELLARSKATVCLCPRSNQAIGVGRAPWARLAAAGVPLCLGTDSLASNADLDLWNEARYLYDHWPGLGLADVLAMMTAVPARVLGLAGDLGSLAPGRLARFAVVPDDLASEPY
jgi:cytosine/adenosine deaminase-related metal-dependent hydrolase